MNRIIDGRGTGKTRKLLEYAYDTRATVVCENPAAMRAKAIAYSLPTLKIVSYQDFFYGDCNDENLVIDELENFVRVYVPDMIGYTQSSED